jgi:hypothetical protein
MLDNVVEINGLPLEGQGESSSPLPLGGVGGEGRFMKVAQLTPVE